MKQYATFRTTNISSPYAGDMDIDHCDYEKDDRSGTLHDICKRGWRVISSAIKAGQFSHDETRYIFILERDIP